MDISKFTVDKYPHGTFSWADGNSTDQAKARQFYAAVMGWTYEDMPLGEDMFYTMFKQAGQNVAGLGQLMPDMMAQGIPSHWMSYVAVDNTDAVAAKVTELGGMVLMPPMDVFEQGRMALFQDPTGAQFGVWQAGVHHGSGLVNVPGSVTWNELGTRDAPKAVQFYSDLFGWQIRKDDNMDYYYINNNDRPNGGIMAMTADWGDTPPNWMVYFSVADIDATLEAVKANGGKVVTGPMDAGGVGRFAVVADPTGGVCSLIQTEQPQPWTE